MMILVEYVHHALYKNSAEFEFGSHSRGCAPLPQNVALGYDVGNISAGRIVSHETVISSVQKCRLTPSVKYTGQESQGELCEDNLFKHLVVLSTCYIVTSLSTTALNAFKVVHRVISCCHIPKRKLRFPGHKIRWVSA